MSNQPKPTFYLVLGIIVTAVTAIAVSRTEKFMRLFSPRMQFSSNIDSSRLGKVEATDATLEPITAVKEYAFKPAERLSALRGPSIYKPMENNTVRVAVSRRAGCWPIILANNGFKPEKIWKTSDGKEFRVELVTIDSPDRAFFQTPQGRLIHVGCDTLDRITLSAEGIEDGRDMPRVFLQLAWSNGADGIVVRDDIKTLTDLRDRRLLLSQTSPYFAMNVLIAAGVQPSEMRITQNMSDGSTTVAAMFAADKQAGKQYAGVIATTPELSKLATTAGNHLLIDTTLANRLVTDVCFARADFARDNPSILESLARGIFDAMYTMKNADPKTVCAKLMAAGYKISETDAMAMLGGVEATNWAENYQFFLNQNNPTNFDRLWRQAFAVYRRLSLVKGSPVRFDEVMDFSAIQKLGEEEKYKLQLGEYRPPASPQIIGRIREDSPNMLTNALVVYFAPNDSDPNRKVGLQIDGKTVAERYDPNVENVLDGVGKLVERLGPSRIVIEGHADNSLRGQASSDPSIKELALNRANAVRDALIEKFNFEPAQVISGGFGWDRPADPREPFHYARNRRVEIRIYPVEK